MVCILYITFQEAHQICPIYGKIDDVMNLLQEYLPQEPTTNNHQIKETSVLLSSRKVYRSKRKPEDQARRLEDLWAANMLLFLFSYQLHGT